MTTKSQSQLCKDIAKMLHDCANECADLGKFDAAAMLHAEGEKYWQQACCDKEVLQWL